MIDDDWQLWLDFYKLSRFLKNIGAYKLSRFEINRDRDFRPYLKRLQYKGKL